MKKILACTLAAVAASAMLAGCNKDGGKEKEYKSYGYTYFAMNTTASLVITDEDTSEFKSAFDSICGKILDELTTVNNSLSPSVKNSAVNAFNAAAAGEKVQIDQTAYSVLNTAKEVYTLTDGAYNPAVYYNVLAYGFNTQSAQYPQTLPSDELIEKYNILSSAFGDLKLSEEDGKYYAQKPTATVEIEGVTYSLKLDLGGIGKGYAVDRINSIIDSYGFKYGNFNFGASSIACKRHYKNGEYSMAFTNPREYGGMYLTTKVSDTLISTSGDYEQAYFIDGKRYCHIIDPATGKPVQTGIMSATVIGGTAAEDDALTTAIMCMGKQKAVEFINEKLTDRKVVFTFEDDGGYQIITNILDGGYEVTGDGFTVVSSVSDGKIILGAK